MGTSAGSPHKEREVASKCRQEIVSRSSTYLAGMRAYSNRGSILLFTGAGTHGNRAGRARITHHQEHKDVVGDRFHISHFLGWEGHILIYRLRC